ncbi:MAG: ABC transporter permease [Cyclobacteriaceae bacterium]
MPNQVDQPPKWAERILNFCCRSDYRDEIIGDLHEAYYWRLAKQGTSKARSRFVWETFLSLKPQNLKTSYHIAINTMIFRNYFKVALRNLVRRKSTSFINIFGLATGATAFIIIFLYTSQILSFDDYHEDKKRIFLAYKERVTPDGIQPAYDTWVPMAKRLKADYPEVEFASSVYQTAAKVIKQNQFIDDNIFYSDQSFFDIFSYELLHGQSASVFPEKRSIAISRDRAIRYFGQEDVIGQLMEVFLPDEDTILTFSVSAVLADFPENISLQPQMMIQMESIPVYPEIADNWGSSFLETYVKLETSESASNLEAKFPDLVEAIWDLETRGNTNFKLLPFESYYDTFIGDKSNARILLMIGIGILVIAAINFMNLSVAHASRRLKEIGMRKVLGAFRNQVRSQFIFEAFITSFLAMLLAVTLVAITIPFFNDFFDVSITWQILPFNELILFLTAMVVFLGIISGLYPALYLSSLRSLDVLQKRVQLGRRSVFQNSLVVVQFVIALFLISSALLIRNQILFMSNGDMGFSDENMLVINASPNDFLNSDQGAVKLNTFKNELKTKSYVKDVALSRSYPTDWTRSFTFVVPDGWTGDRLRMRYTYVDANFLKMYGINMISGRHFLADSEGSQRESVILNRAAMEAFEFEPNEPNVIKIGDRRLNVVGISEDFSYESLQVDVAPHLIFHRTADNPAHRYISINIETSHLSEKLDELERMWNELGSTNEFTYHFLDDRVAQLYEAENRYLGLVTLFSIVSIIVACLGLYGLTLFIIEKRQKELSIRKVLGAETGKILGLIIRDFAKWVLLAFVISIPFVISFVGKWLEDYHHRLPISWVTFLITLILVLVLVILTIGYQSLKVAFSNPVKYLKDE